MASADAGSLPGVCAFPVVRRSSGKRSRPGRSDCGRARRCGHAWRRACVVRTAPCSCVSSGWTWLAASARSGLRSRALRSARGRDSRLCSGDWGIRRRCPSMVGVAAWPVRPRGDCRRNAVSRLPLWPRATRAIVLERRPGLDVAIRRCASAAVRHDAMAHCARCRAPRDSYSRFRWPTCSNWVEAPSGHQPCSTSSSREQ